MQHIDIWRNYVTRPRTQTPNPHTPTLCRHPPPPFWAQRSYKKCVLEWFNMSSACISIPFLPFQRGASVQLQLLKLSLFSRATSALAPFMSLTASNVNPTWLRNLVYNIANWTIIRASIVGRRMVLLHTQTQLTGSGGATRTRSGANMGSSVSGCIHSSKNGNGSATIGITNPLPLS